MDIKLRVLQLQAFEQRVAEAFNEGKIRAPIHLSHNNEESLIRYFDDQVTAGDWFFSTWRSHYHALLAGIPEGKVLEAVLAGRSITLCFPEWNFYASAIVGGHLSWALGVAYQIRQDTMQFIAAKPKEREKIMQKEPRVHAFLGDMAAFSGVYAECSRYAHCHGLPITFIEEDNGLSVMTKTDDVYPRPKFQENGPWATRYSYDLSSKWPHSGAGKRIDF